MAHVFTFESLSIISSLRITQRHDTDYHELVGHQKGHRDIVVTETVKRLNILRFAHRKHQNKQCL